MCFLKKKEQTWWERRVQLIITQQTSGLNVRVRRSVEKHSVWGHQLLLKAKKNPEHGCLGWIFLQCNEPKRQWESPRLQNRSGTQQEIDFSRRIQNRKCSEGKAAESTRKQKPLDPGFRNILKTKLQLSERIVLKIKATCMLLLFTYL